MRKLIFILFIFFMASLCFANPENQNTEDTDLESIEETMEDMENQLLQILDDDDGSLDSLGILQENNDEYLEKNAEIEEVNRKIAQNKRQHTAIRTASIGLNLPFTYFPQYGVIDNSSTPVGISLSMLTTNDNRWSCKMNLNFDFPYKDYSIYAPSISLGRTFNNHYFLFGYYATLGFEIGSMSGDDDDDDDKGDAFFNIGASGTIAFKFIGNSKIYLNLDALYRIGDEEDVSYYASLINTWKICPSVGVILDVSDLF